jgi:O-antigen/teichoic acid export membrane protein
MIDSQHSHSLKKKSVSAVLWSGGDAFLRQGLQFVVSIILARLLTPEEFGTVALLYLFTGIAGVFIDSGFSAALVQRQDVTHTDESTVFWFSLGMGAATAALLWLVAPWIAGFYGQPVLVPLTAILAISLLINSLGSIHMTLLTKRLDFKTPMKVGAAATSVSGLVAVGMATSGFGIWALASQVLAASIVTTALLWLLSRWRPALVFSLESARRLFGFGGFLMASSLLDVAYNRLYTLLLGKLYGVRDLGLYTRADNTKQIPVDLLANTLSRVAFPIFSAAASDREKLKRGLRLAIRGAMLFNVPMMLGLMATADNVILVLFGAQWLGAVPLLQVLCLAGVFWPLHVLNLNALKAQGHSRLFFRLEIFKKIIGVAFIVAGVQFGVLGIAISQVAFGALAFLINSHYTATMLNYGWLQQLRDTSGIAFASFMMLCAVLVVGAYVDEAGTLKLALQVATGVAVYLTLGWTLRLRAFSDARWMFSPRAS